MFLHPGRDSIRESCTTCYARVNEECGTLVTTWKRQPTVDELRTFVEAAANDADPYWLAERAREIMEG